MAETQSGTQRETQRETHRETHRGTQSETQRETHRGTHRGTPGCDVPGSAECPTSAECPGITDAPTSAECAGIIKGPGSADAPASAESPGSAGGPDDALDGLVRWIRSERVSVGICLAYGFAGLGVMLAGRPLAQTYMVLMYFFVSKMVVDYNKCTLSYIECKIIRGVPRERGLLDALVSAVVGASRDPKMKALIAAYTALATYYFFWVQGGVIRI